jgi:hypothetical protein
MAGASPIFHFLQYRAGYRSLIYSLFPFLTKYNGGAVRYKHVRLQLTQ